MGESIGDDVGEVVVDQRVLDLAAAAVALHDAGGLQDLQNAD
ncbi:hypothetical protein [Gordonia sp. (in: high G+C Gram-positive bacteria)]